MNLGDLEAPRAKSSLPPDAAIEGYQILRETARGGTATVCEALETSVDRRVALKILPAAATLDQRQVNRFRTEAIIAARFDHPHIIPVYTVDCEAALPYFAMKFIAGHSLAEQLELWRQSTKCGTREHLLQAVEWCIQAAEAVQHVHSSGYTHGDLKPSNMLLDHAGKLWLADFDSARPIKTDGDSCEQRPTLTPRYASPEQLLGNSAGDARSDIYGLGITLFELVTLRPAVVGDSVQDLLCQLAEGGQASGSNFSPSVPSELNAIIGRATAVDPTQRFSAASDFADQLREFRDNKHCLLPCDSQNEPHGRRSNRRTAAIYIAALIVLALGVTPYLSNLRIAYRQKHVEAVAEKQWRSLVRLNQTELDEIADQLARGLQVDADAQQLLEEGPSTQVLKEMAFDSEWIAKLRLEFAKTSYQLAEIHRQQFHFQKSHEYLERTLQWCDALIEAEPRFVYRLDRALVQIRKAELCAELNRISEAEELAEQAINAIRSVYIERREAPAAQFALAWCLIRSGYVLYHVSPTEKRRSEK